MKSIMAYSALALSFAFAHSEASTRGISSVAFDVPAYSRAKGHFEKVPPESSGLIAVNRYDDPSMWNENWRRYFVGAVATGITVGDFDLDGLPDIYVLCRTGPNHLYRNLGDFGFEDVTDRAGVAGHASNTWVSGATFVDINGDGFLDIYVCYQAAPNQLFMNQGNGTFVEMSEKYGLAINSSSVMASFADYDRDGRLDMFLVTNLLKPNGGNAEPDYLFHQKSDGTFEDVSERAGLARDDFGQGFAGIWWDPLGNGWPDLYVANDFAVPDRFYRNQRDGTFTNVLDESGPDIPYSAMGADSGDINNDGLPDLIVADMLPSKHKRLLKYSSVDFEQQLMHSEAAVPQIPKNSLWLNQGGGHFAEIANFAGVAATDWTWSVLFGDLDNDGWLDLHVTNGMFRDFMDGDAIFAQDHTKLSEAEFWKRKPVMEERNFAFRNDHNLKFSDVSKLWGLDDLGVSFGAVMADFDRDGALDIVQSNFEGPPTLYHNLQHTGHAILVQLRSDSSCNKFGVGCTVRLHCSHGILSRVLTLSRGLGSGQPHELHFGLGSDTEIPELEVLWPSGKKQVFNDLSVDRIYTITEPTEPAPEVQKTTEATHAIFKEVSKEIGLGYLHHGRDVLYSELKSQPLLPQRMTRLGPGLSCTDLDGDGIDDILEPGGIDNEGMFFGSLAPNKHSSLPFLSASSNEGLATLVFEANGDGRPDVLVSANTFKSASATTNAGGVHLWLGNLDNTFKEASQGTIPEFLASPGAICAADYDSDGDLDLFIGGRYLPGRYPHAVSSAIWENRGGIFTDVTSTVAPMLQNCGLVTGAVWSDVNNDGKPDLLIVREWGAPLYLENDGAKFVDRSKEVGISNLSGWWNSIAGSDLNGDGRIDFVLGNVGLNTRYRASPEKPALLLSGEFGNAGEWSILEALFDGEVLRPQRNQVDLSRGFRSKSFSVSLLKRFPTFGDYADASLEEIIPPEKLSNSEIYSAGVFETGLLLQNTTGGFVWRPLPSSAQFAPVFGIVAEDFDGDGFIDIALAQNSSRPVPYVGRFTGGVGAIFKGGPNGTFEPLTSSESGFLIRGDGRGLVVSDFNKDGWPDLLAAQTNGPILAFQNQGRSTRKSSSIELIGSKGNPHAIGARVTIRWEDGTKRVSEIKAGEGYLSQNCSRIFVSFEKDQPPSMIEIRWPDGKESQNIWRDECRQSCKELNSDSLNH